MKSGAAGVCVSGGPGPVPSSAHRTALTCGGLPPTAERALVHFESISSTHAPAPLKHPSLSQGSESFNPTSPLAASIKLTPLTPVHPALTFLKLTTCAAFPLVQNL